MNQKLSGEIKAVLFDLDGTLLEMDMKLFLREYLNALSKSVIHLIPPKKLVPALMKASKAIESNNGVELNEDAYAKAFFPIEGYERDDLEPLFVKFYREEFPKLQFVSKRKPSARKVVQKAINIGYDVVVATTPLLPLVAIEERLDWAGVKDLPFKLITSYENSHATKPNLHYYKEILEKIDRPAEACLMVGDEDKDMVAAKLGIKTFLIESSRTQLNPDTPKPDFQGTLDDLLLML
ncbi:MAG: HAD-IA family hydrolase [Candidatus Lokiarchaeota archaeon]|nr:HAD-IA family hydrolase [Candidatus Lokiarchaeota archaeon]MBD3342845.1 HAD-IA family hydrolase [Candidatus Lokiarchaeota archaeon]